MLLIQWNNQIYYVCSLKVKHIIAEEIRLSCPIRHQSVHAEYMLRTRSLSRARALTKS